MGKRNKKKVSTPKRFKQVSKEVNPFEVRVNRQHHSVLGRKKKQDRGLPGVSRNKAIQKRKNTLLKEYQQLHKSNRFVDRRIGEYDATVDPDGKAVARFAREWRKNRKGDMFNLNDEDLTHMGHSLGDIEEFDVPKSDSEDDDANLKGEFVKKAHFGGFMTVKNSNFVEPEKSHKEIMQELIAETKKKKYERQVERETTTDLTEKLDQDWKVLQSLLSKTKPMVNADSSKNEDDYDINVNTLKYEVRGKASDPLKTQGEMLREQNDKMQQLEAERQKRMKGPNVGSSQKITHISADSLNDSILLDQDADDELVSDNLSVQDELKLSNTPNSIVEERSVSDDNIDEENDDGSDDDDSYADIISDHEDSEIEVDSNGKDEIKNKIIRSSKPDLPISKIPSSPENLVKLFLNKTIKEQSAIVGNIIKLYDPGLGEGNRKKLEKFFLILLQHVHDVCKDRESDLSIIDALIPHLYTFLQISPVTMSKAFLDIMKEKRKEFLKKCQVKGGKKVPTLETLIFFKLVSIFYPTSDFNHPVVTCASLFMSEILVNCPSNTLPGIIIGLFVCSLFLEYVSYAKRLVPEAIVYLTSLLPVLQYNSTKEKVNQLLLITSDVEVAESIPLKWLVEIPSIPSTSQVKYNLLNSCISLLCDYAKLYFDLPAFHEFFELPLRKCRALEQKFFLPELKNKLLSLEEAFKKSGTNKQLSHEKRKPHSLKMYEPRFQEGFNGKKPKPTMSAKKAEHQKLQYKYKKEFKGAVREIRRDNQFISQQQLQDQLKKDMDRKQKVKRLYQDLAQQEGEFKKYKKRRR